ncbi:MAG: type I methionyl aminopeptidase [Candidatus Dojkabacteria bacterium]
MQYENIIKTKEDYKTLKEATRISVKILKQLRDSVQIGVTAKSIDELTIELCEENGVKPAFNGVDGVITPFWGNICISTNDEILHTIPTERRVFKSGDIVKLDFGIVYKGFYTDHCVTVGLGKLSENEEALIKTAKLCIDTALKNAVIGKTIGDISSVMQNICEISDFDFVTTYCGHGIGRSLHLAPEIPSYGEAGEGEVLQDGMVLCIENQITIGMSDLKLSQDGWTLKTIDGSKGAMFEHMVIVRDGKPEILTSMD